MRVLGKMRNLALLDRKTGLLLMEAFLYLGWARLLVLLPFRKTAPRLGLSMCETSARDNPSHKASLRKVYYAIHVMSKYTLWDNKCLDRAMAGLLMLNRRGIASTLYLGTAKDEAGGMKAHAWLRSGPYYITGAEEMKGYTVVGKFAKQNDAGLCEGMEDG